MYDAGDVNIYAETNENGYEEPVIYFNGPFGSTKYKRNTIINNNGSYYNQTFTFPEEGGTLTTEEKLEEALREKLDRQPVTDNSGYKVYLENPNGIQEMRYVGGRQNYIAKYFGETNGKDGSVETIGLTHLLTNTPKQPYQCANKLYVDQNIDYYPEYDSETTYSSGSIVKRDGILYGSLKASNKGNPLTDTEW